MVDVAEVPLPVRTRIAPIEFLVLDVDGVLTDGRIIYAEHGDELKHFDVQDGAGLVFWHRAGLKSAMITGRTSRLVKRRAKEMRVNVVVQGQLIKLPIYERLLKQFRLTDAQVCVIGDDLMELPLLRRAGFAVAVPSAVEEIKHASHYVTHRLAGRGSVPDVIDLILSVKGLWDAVLQRYE